MILELLMSLSLNDYRDLAKAVQVEADQTQQMNTVLQYLF